MQVGGGGLPGSVVQGAQFAASSANPVTSAISTIAGPTAGLALTTLNNANKAVTGNPKPLVREAVQKIPVVGRLAANALMPSDYQEPAKAGEAPKSDATPAELKNQADADLDKIKKDYVDGYGIQKLVDGRIVYVIDNEIKTTKDIKKMRSAVARDMFEKSGESSKVMGDEYHYIDENGDAKSMPKYKHEFDVVDSQNQLDMYIAKEDGDIEGWMKSATSQLEALETLKKKYNADSQEDKIDDVQKKIETLKAQMAKYAGYGGFTKGSGGGSGGGASSNYMKYALDLNAGGSFKTPSNGSAPAKVKVGIKRKETTAKPSVSIKRSMV
jgi:hypothetical protein